MPLGQSLYWANNAPSGECLLKILLLVLILHFSGLSTNLTVTTDEAGDTGSSLVLEPLFLLVSLHNSLRILLQLII